eukprot:TRINITY_DN11938_c0_g2_i1.p2 TRINITY_DN11938_c0_g2~~TRINITY_DN11938_c0_g2_i1.p2  ORF type:complete len:107 (+),score=1.77 TRINITY_DN11938_c0_g2_i1:168-488(+)
MINSYIKRLQKSGHSSNYQTEIRSTHCQFIGDTFGFMHRIIIHDQYIVLHIPTEAVPNVLNQIIYDFTIIPGSFIADGIDPFLLNYRNFLQCFAEFAPENKQRWDL